ncbi:metal tolerance protein B-like [Tripterygium wilfordii]|nr:metal tolerance protein B-like [Tripterygium wilfordii]
MEHEEVSSLISASQQDMEMLMVPVASDVHQAPSQSSCSSACAFYNPKNTLFESEERSKSATKISVLIIFYLMVMMVEIVGGLKANSLAVITDAVHLLTDVFGFAISLFTVWASGWEATSDQSFGYSRLEVFGSLISVQLIWLISGRLIYEAVNMILHKHSKVNGALMFSVAAFGFIINLIMVTWLGHNHAHHACIDKDHDHTHHACVDKDHNHVHNHEGGLCAKDEVENARLVSSPPAESKLVNINLEGVYLHVVADLIQSVGVMIAGTVIWAKPNWLLVDLICTLVFSVLALSATVPMLRNIFRILMDRTPSEINVASLESGLKCIKGVRTIHDLHVWAITAGKYVLSCHLVADPGVSSNEILCQVRDYCERTYRIHHITVQVEQ